MATVIDGDLFLCPQGPGHYLAHQCNCVTRKAAHLSWQVFKRYPTADIYSPRATGAPRGVPGTLVVIPPIINLLGQFAPGRSRQKNDTYAMRLTWFKEGLENLQHIDNLKMISFPWTIGCGAAGGNWEDYHAAIDDWARTHPNVSVRIYRWKVPTIESRPLSAFFVRKNVLDEQPATNKYKTK
jgi:hypothetical protein